MLSCIFFFKLNCFNFLQVESEVCSLNSDQTNKLLSPLEEVLADITADESALDRIVEMIQAVDRSSIIPALQETTTFLADLADVLSTPVDGKTSFDTAAANLICKFKSL